MADPALAQRALDHRAELQPVLAHGRGGAPRVAVGGAGDDRLVLGERAASGQRARPQQLEGLKLVLYRLLLEDTAARLRARGLRVLLPGRLPPNDGSISYGQVAVAAAA